MEYAIYITATGELVSRGTVVGDVPAHMTQKDYPSGIPKNTIWDEVTKDFVPRPPNRNITVVDFYERFTRPELLEILGANPTDFTPNQAKRIRAIRNYFAGVNRINLDDALITSAMTVFVNLNFITATRRDEILA